MPVPEGTFLAPLPRPEQLHDCLVFEAHLINAFAKAREMTGRDFAIPQVWYDQPICYKSNRFSVIGHGQDVRWPAYSNHMDLELELAIVIGKGGSDIRIEDAPDHIFNYTIFNDMTAETRKWPDNSGPPKARISTRATLSGLIF